MAVKKVESVAGVSAYVPSSSFCTGVAAEGSAAAAAAASGSTLPALGTFAPGVHTGVALADPVPAATGRDELACMMGVTKVPHRTGVDSRRPSVGCTEVGTGRDS